MNGATRCTRLLGCSYLHPHVIPDPHVNSVALGNDDALVVIGNATLWSHVTPVEAVAEIRDVTDPVSAAKRLRDLAQVTLVLVYNGFYREKFSWVLSKIRIIYFNNIPKNTYLLTFQPSL